VLGGYSVRLLTVWAMRQQLTKAEAAWVRGLEAQVVSVRVVTRAVLAGTTVVTVGAAWAAMTVVRAAVTRLSSDRLGGNWGRWPARHRRGWQQGLEAHG